MGISEAISVSEPSDWWLRLSRLRAQVAEGLDAAIPPKGPVAMVEFPGADTNVGNHLMWLATTRYLRSRGRRISYVAHRKNYRADQMAHAIGRGPILIAGGAAISGLWPEVRFLRERVIADFPDNPIVILPQTVAFLDEEDRESSRAALDAHPDLTLLARDHCSLELAEATYRRARIRLVPDLAFLLTGLRRRRPASQESIWLRRKDVEAVAAEEFAADGTFDWAGRDMRNWRLAYVLLRASGVASRLRNQVPLPIVQGLTNRLLAEVYATISARVVAEGNRLADAGEVFVSDRLHGHLLATLRGQPTVAMPDAYGKNKALYQAWTCGFPFAAWAESSEEARLAVRSLVGAQSWGVE